MSVRGLHLFVLRFCMRLAMFYFYDERPFPFWLEFAFGFCSAGSDQDEVPLFKLFGSDSFLLPGLRLRLIFVQFFKGVDVILIEEIFSC